MRYHPTPMTNAFQFPPKSPRTDPHKHSLALIVDVTKISNIYFRDPKNMFWGRTIAHPGCRGSFWHLLSHPRPLVADSSALFSRRRVRKSAIKALVLTVPASYKKKRLVPPAPPPPEGMGPPSASKYIKTTKVDN